jgi:hypothetical protein
VSMHMYVAVFSFLSSVIDRLRGQSRWLQIKRSGVRFPALTYFMRSSGSGTESIRPREYTRGVNGVICVAEKSCVSIEERTEFLNII